MTTMEVIPSVTTAEILELFRYLVDAELRKSIGDTGLLREGCQEGYITSMIHRYGSATDEDFERAYNNKETWSYMVRQIIDNHLSGWLSIFEKLDNVGDVDLEKFDKAVEEAVSLFELQHPGKLRNSLKYL